MHQLRKARLSAEIRSMVNEMTDADTFQMLWDCEFCGSQKLLGLDHRHCPGCGAAQNPEARYFPADAERVAVKDHVYAGKDIRCAACQSPSSQAADFCGNCGCALAQGSEVKTATDALHGEHEAYAGGTSLLSERRRPAADAMGAANKASVPASSGVKMRLIGLVIAAIVGLGAVAVFWTSPVQLEVVGHTWSHEIGVQELRDVRSSDWCDSLPSRARVIDRERKQRGTKKVRDGEVCKTRKKDKGDGTYRQVRECKPKYRSEPAYDQWCDYRAEKWQTIRTERKAGGRGEPRVWPQVVLRRPGSCLGCQREASRVSKYVVLFEESKDRVKHQCTLSLDEWNKMVAGSRWMGEKRKLSSGISCSSFNPV